MSAGHRLNGQFRQGNVSDDHDFRGDWRPRELVIDPEFKALIPPLSSDEYTMLEESILAEGCRDALVVWKRTLLDGHNRYTICHEHGVHFDTVERDFDSREDALVWIIQNQFGRRNLTPFARSELALRLKDVIAAKARDNMSAGGKGCRILQPLDDKGFQNSGNLPADTDDEGLPNLATLHTRTALAQIADVSHDTIHKVAAVVEHAPDAIKAAARRGDLSVDRAYRLTRALEEASEAVQAAVSLYEIDDPDTVLELKRLEVDAPDTFEEVTESGYIQPGDEAEAVALNAGYRSLKEALKLKSRIHAQLAQEARQQAAAATPLPQGVYRCIVIDPPWPVDKIEREARPNQGAHLDYPTLEIDTIAALPIPSLAYEDGCHLYLWTTQKFLPQALDLMKAWGFQYQCLLTWVKPTGMTPFTWMYNTEHVLFGTRGGLRVQQMGLKLSFDAPVVGHSVKPDVFYERVAKASPGPRLDMFARQQHDGFVAWGDEV